MEKLVLGNDLLHQIDQIHHAVAETTFIVVPGQNFHHVPTDDSGVLSIHNGAEWIPVEVVADQWFFAETQNTFQGTL